MTTPQTEYDKRRRKVSIKATAFMDPGEQMDMWQQAVAHFGGPKPAILGLLRFWRDGK